MASVRCIHRIGEGGKTNRGQTDGLEPSIQGREIEGHKTHSGDRILQWNNGKVRNAAYFFVNILRTDHQGNPFLFT